LYVTHIPEIANCLDFDNQPKPKSKKSFPTRSKSIMTEHQKPAHKQNPQLSPIKEVFRNTTAIAK
jgi:hypothetical protein